MSDIILRQFEGQPVRFDSRGWVNATEIARRYGKEPNDLLRQRETVEYLVEMSEALGMAGCLPEFNEIKALSDDSASFRVAALRIAKQTGLVRTKAGSPANGGGTWLHPKARVLLGRWVSAKFAVWCDLEMDAILTGRHPQPDPNALSTVADREPLYLLAIQIMVKHGLSLPVIYRALAHFAGVESFKAMLLGHIAQAGGFGGAILAGTDSGAQWRQLESNRIAITGHCSQSKLDLGPLVLGSYRTREVTHA